MNGSFLCAIRGPILMITLGVLLAIDQFGANSALSFTRTWPVLLIVFGLFKLAERASTKSV
jgi:EamA domain-containing membrane protein RarD